MQEGKTIGQLMEEMRQKAGAQNYHGHDYMDLQRFAENTRHMIIFDVSLPPRRNRSRSDEQPQAQAGSASSVLGIR